MSSRRVTAYGRKGHNFVRARDVDFRPGSKSQATPGRNKESGMVLEDTYQTTAAEGSDSDSDVTPKGSGAWAINHAAPAHKRKPGKENKVASTLQKPQKNIISTESPSANAPLKPKARKHSPARTSRRMQSNVPPGRTPLALKFSAERSSHLESSIASASRISRRSVRPSATGVQQGGRAKQVPPTAQITSTEPICLSSDDDDEPVQVKWRMKSRPKALLILSDEESDANKDSVIGGTSISPINLCNDSDEEISTAHSAKLGAITRTVRDLDLRETRPVDQEARNGGPSKGKRATSQSSDTSPVAIRYTRKSSSARAVGQIPAYQPTTRVAPSRVQRDGRSRLAGSIASLPKDVIDAVAATGDLDAAMQHLTPRTRMQLGEGTIAKDSLSSSAKRPVTRRSDKSSTLPKPLHTSSSCSSDEIIPSSQSFILADSTPSPRDQELSSLLQACQQGAVMDFSEFIASFIFDELHGKQAGRVSLRKLGEASFSEVFVAGDLVLKIIPVQLDCEAGFDEVDDVDLPSSSTVAEVEREIKVTREMGSLHKGFVQLLKAFVVCGRYPTKLLDLWDEYECTKGSENVRPDVMPSSMCYAIIVLPHEGVDLENFTFSSEIGWKQAVSIWWQVARALGPAEEASQFEHRDLHWGQVLVKESPSEVGEVKATIIDLGLSRMVGEDGRTYFTEFDSDIFNGKGDYQFDIYRLMKKHNNGDWESFAPLTNVMWLHYLAVKLLKYKGLASPAASARGKTLSRKAAQDRQWHGTLVDIEAYLAKAVKPQRRGKKAESSERRPRNVVDVMTWIQEQMDS